MEFTKNPVSDVIQDIPKHFRRKPRICISFGDTISDIQNGHPPIYTSEFRFFIAYSLLNILELLKMVYHTLLKKPVRQNQAVKVRFFVLVMK